MFFKADKHPSLSKEVQPCAEQICGIKEKCSFFICLVFVTAAVLSSLSRCVACVTYVMTEELTSGQTLAHFQTLNLSKLMSGALMEMMLHGFPALLALLALLAKQKRLFHSL